MSKVIFCQKLKKEAPGLASLPVPGPLGQRIFDNISKEAWDMWVLQQTMFINENRLSLFEPEARRKIELEMERFLFEE